MRSNLLGFLLLFVVASCAEKEGSVFKYLRSSSTNVTFSNSITESDELNILDYLYFYNGGGVAVGDINNDGLPDIFFSANQNKNALYLNKGNMSFEDISESAGIQGNSDWNTGAIMVDINNDGWLDIYVNAVVGINGFDGYNELYINNQDNTFTESARAYNLDFDTYSSSTAFFDYDLDGDLDLYILNHAVHTQNSFGNSSLRNERNYESGDRLMRNEGGRFTDVSEEAGIFGGINGYGLGISVADFNQDGYPDIYIGNDFHEDDYFYINQKNGTFKNELKNYFTQTTRFSMGNDAADINHDGLPDLMSLDMLPEDEKVLKSSEGDDNIQTLKLRTERYGYHYQFTRNMFNINQGDQKEFLETALYSNVAATDWSWSTIIEDFNQDGEQDIFISNGIPKRPNDLDFIRFVSSDKIQNKINDTKLVDQQALDLMPSGKTSNYVFEGTKGLQFKDQSSAWIASDTLASGATAYADLDLDGDLDLIINNLNAEASILENKTNNPNYLTINLNGNGNSAVGAKVYAYQNDQLQFKEFYTVRGFQASSEPIIHFAYTEAAPLDSLVVVWPDNKKQKLTSVNLGQRLTIEKAEGLQGYAYEREHDEMKIFKQLPDSVVPAFHKEDRYIDFNRQKLMPFQAGDRGPGLALGDWNNDGKSDIFLGSSKFQQPQLLIQSDENFKVEELPNEIKSDSILEIVSAVMSDFDSDNTTDLFIGTGGADFFGKSPRLLDVVYSNNSSDSINRMAIKDLYENASVVKSNDVDGDGDLDLFIGNHIVTGDYGSFPNSYLLLNENGSFQNSNTKAFEKVGMLTDAIFTDLNSDGIDDLVVVGEWMQPKFFINNSGNFSESMLLNEEITGLYQSVYAFDYDNDGDLDLALGNWGLNSKFKASDKEPLKLYYSDFDNNKQTETITAYAKNGDYYPVHGLDELGGQMVSLKKKYTSYESFAGQTVEVIFDKKVLKDSKVLEVNNLASGVLLNENGKYSFKPFDELLQLSPITSFLSYDFDSDGAKELLIGGNYFGVTPYHGRLASFPGAIIESDQSIMLSSKFGLNLTNTSIRHLEIIDFKNKPHLLVVANNEKVKLFEIVKE